MGIGQQPQPTKNPDNNLNPEMLEQFITPQLSMSCDELELIRKIVEKVGISFVLTKSLSLHFR